MSVEAMKLARKAMASFQNGTNGLYEGEFDEEIAALDHAIEQVEQAKPVAEVIARTKLENESPELTPRIIPLVMSLSVGTKLYTAPPRHPEQATYTCGVCGVSMQMETKENT